MSTYKEMMEARQKAMDLGDSVTGFVLRTNEIRKAEFEKINNDPDLSPAGKARKRDEFNKKMADAFMKDVRKMRSEYEENVVKAAIKAESLLNEKPSKPDVMTLSTFERNFSDLKVKVMLSTNTDSAIKMLEDFASENTNPYFSKQVLDSFPELASNVLSSAGDKAVHSKGKLGQLFESIKHSALSDEQKQAQEIHGLMKANFSRNLFLESGLEMQKVNEMFGPQVSYYVNKPSEYKTSEEKLKEQEQQGAE